jgi:hypothetical protein
MAPKTSPKSCQPPQNDGPRCEAHQARAQVGRFSPASAITEMQDTAQQRHSNIFLAFKGDLMDAMVGEIVRKLFAILEKLSHPMTGEEGNRKEAG